MRILFTADLVRKLHFEQRPVGVIDGKLRTEATPSHVKDWTLRDELVRGFGVRVTRNSKSYFVQRKRGGSTSDRWVLTQQHSLRAARAEATEWLGKMARGDDPREEKKERLALHAAVKAARANTFGKAFEDYTGEDSTRLLRPSSVKDRKYAMRWMHETSLWPVPMSELDKTQVHQVFAPWFAAAEQARAKRERKRGSGPAGDLASCYKALRHCRAVWRRAAQPKGDVNPFKEWFEEQSAALAEVEPRQNTFTRDEFIAWLRAMEKARNAPEHRVNVVADFLMLVVLWGFRKRETMLLRWETLNLDAGYGSLPQLTTKKKRTRYFPLCPWAVDILRGRMKKNAEAGFMTKPQDFVFPSARKEDTSILEYRYLGARLKEQCGVWVGAHDLRRAVATEVFGETLDVNSVSLALGHRKKNVSVDYIQDLQRVLRPLFEKREHMLRRLLGLETEPELTDQQKGILEAARLLLKQANLSADLVGIP